MNRLFIETLETLETLFISRNDLQECNGAYCNSGMPL